MDGMLKKTRVVAQRQKVSQAHRRCEPVADARHHLELPRRRLAASTYGTIERREVALGCARPGHRATVGVCIPTQGLPSHFIRKQPRDLGTESCGVSKLSLIHISEPTRLLSISYA